MRGTFGNVRLRNQLAPGTEGPRTQWLPGGEERSIYDAAMRYREEGTPLIVMAGKEAGTGSSRDWAAKGPALLGVRAVIAESVERIYRSNLIGMGVLPLEFKSGETAASLKLTGKETFSITGLADGIEPKMNAKVAAQSEDGNTIEFEATVRIDSPIEVEYYRHGGILDYVLREYLE